MAGKISFQFLLEGTETAAAKLKAIEGLTQNISKGISAGDLFGATQGNFSQSTLARNPQLMAMFAQQGKVAGKTFENARFEAMNDLARRGGSQAMINRQASVAMMDWKLNNYTGPKPPIISSAGGGGSFGGLFRALGLGGGGSAAGGIPVVAAALAAFALTVKVAKEAMEQLVKAVQEGAKLFTDSARLGLPQGQLFGIRAGLNAIGVTNADQILLQGEFGGMMRQGRGGLTGRSVTSRRGMSADVDGIMVGAMRVGNMGDIQAIHNLSGYLHEFIKESKLDENIMKATSRQLYETSFAWNRFKTELTATFSGFAAEISVLLIPLLKMATAYLHNYNVIFFEVIKKLQQWGIISKSLDFSNVGGMGNQRIQANAMQRMGFVFGSGNFQTNYASETARNTKQTAINTAKMAARIGEGFGNGILGAIGAYATNP